MFASPYIDFKLSKIKFNHKKPRSFGARGLSVHDTRKFEKQRYAEAYNV